MEKICKNCEHCEVIFEIDLYCYNPECDIEFSNDPECDNYMGFVEDDDSCKLFKEKIIQFKK